MDTLRTILPKATKDHKCNFCDGKIDKGTTYQIQSIVNDRRIYNWKSHLRCIEIADKLRMYDSCDEGITQDDFYEIIKDTFHALHKDEEDYNIPDFQGQLDFVCEKYLIADN